MPVRKDNTTAALAKLQNDLGRRLLAAAVTLVSEIQRRVSTSAGPTRRKGSRYTTYSNPSKPGEYPHLRTGHGRASYGYEPTTVAGVIGAGLKVKIGVRQLGHYMLILELHRQRLGILKTAEDLRGVIKAVITRKGP